ncbi:MAG: aconitase X [Pusillimonas sp.]
MHLTSEEQAMLEGKHGKAVQEAIQFQIEVGSFFGAERLVPITNAHVMGDIEVMGDGGLGLLKDMRNENARCAVPTTSNARCMHFESHPDLRADECEVHKEKELIAQLRGMNINTTDTCINYQTVYQPKLGEHVAWGDTGTVIYANSVFGARTNFEAGKSSFAASLTGRTPAYGFHLDECRKGTIAVKVLAEMKDLADWGALGKIVGHPNQDYFAVPVFEGIDSAPLSDALKHLGASLASYGSMAMFHMVGITPEAPSADAAMGGNTPTSVITVRNEDIQAVYDAYQYVDGAKNIVVFSGPQQSLFEMQALAQLFEGRHLAHDMACVVTTSHAIYSDASRLGYIATLEKAGVTILQGVCFYILQRLTQIRAENEWANLISNSAKIVNTITAHRFNTVLRRTRDCVEIACTGDLK